MVWWCTIGTSSWQELNDTCAVIKDMHGIRAKGVMVEDLLEAVEEHFPEAKTHLKYGPLGGMPDAYVGVRSMSEWVTIRSVLRDMKLARQK